MSSIAAQEVITSVSYTADGATQTYTFPFPYLSRSHVKVTVDGVAVEYDFGTAYTIILAAAPLAGSKIKIYRQTPFDQPFITWTDGTVMLADDLNAQLLQVLFVLQENEALFLISDFLEQARAIKLTTEQARDDAQTAKNTAVSASGTATSAKTAAIDAKNAAETAKTEAETAKSGADTAKSGADSAKTAALAAQTAAEAAKTATLAASAVTAWNSTATYNFGDLVYYTDGHTYRFIGSTTTGGLPPVANKLWVRQTVLVNYDPDYTFMDGGCFNDDTPLIIDCGTF